jgi:hypothetical protein
MAGIAQGRLQEERRSWRKVRTCALRCAGCTLRAAALTRADALTRYAAAPRVPSGPSVRVRGAAAPCAGRLDKPAALGLLRARQG